MLRRHLVLAAAMAAALPCVAVGATRIATPAGAGVLCTDADPCSLVQAVQAGNPGDEVVLKGAVFTIGAALNVFNSNMTIRGESAAAKPLISYTGGAGSEAVFVSANGVTLRDVRITGTNNSNATLFLNGANTGTVLDRVQVTNLGTNSGVFGRLVTMRDSVIATASTTEAAAEVSGTITGSTLVATAGSGAALAVDDQNFLPLVTEGAVVRNTILLGGTGGDVLVRDVSGAIPTLDVDFSALRANGVTQFPAPPNAAIVTVGANNVSSAPLLATAALGADVRQLAGSPTIDRGSAAAAALSATDLDGGPRTLGAAPDIGADEYAPPPTVTTGPATAVTTTSATLNATVTPNGQATTYSFELGTSTAYGITVPGQAAAGSGLTGVAATGLASGLSPATTYNYRVVATNAAGTTRGPNVTFTTTGSPATGGDDTTAPAVTALTVSVPRRRPARASTVTFTLGETARVTVTLERLAPGRRRGARCLPTAVTGTRCTRVVRVVVVTRPGTAAGPVAVPLPARRFAFAGRYRVTVVATDAAGNRSRAVTRVVTVK